MWSPAAPERRWPAGRAASRSLSIHLLALRTALAPRRPLTGAGCDTTTCRQVFFFINPRNIPSWLITETSEWFINIYIFFYKKPADAQSAVRASNGSVLAPRPPRRDRRSGRARDCAADGEREGERGGGGGERERVERVTLTVCASVFYTLLILSQAYEFAFCSNHDRLQPFHVLHTGASPTHPDKPHQWGIKPPTWMSPHFPHTMLQRRHLAGKQKKSDLKLSTEIMLLALTRSIRSHCCCCRGLTKCRPVIDAHPTSAGGRWHLERMEKDNLTSFQSYIYIYI